MKIGFTSTTFRHIKKLDEIVSLAEKANADCIEWGGDVHVKSTADAENARALCEKAGLFINSYGSYYVIGSNDTAKQNEVLDIVKALGAGAVRVWLGDKGSAKTDAITYGNMLSDAARLCDEAGKHGIVIVPECHPNTYNDNTDAFLKFAHELDKPNFGTYFQSLYRNSAYDYDRLSRTLPYIRTVHISYSEQMRMQFFGKHNNMYIDGLLSELLKLGFNKTVLLEYTYFEGGKYFVKDMARLRNSLNG